VKSAWGFGEEGGFGRVLDAVDGEGEGEGAEGGVGADARRRFARGRWGWCRWGRSR